MKRRCVFLIACALAAPLIMKASAESEVVVVYNSRVPESKEIAEYYATVRHVPRNQVMGFSLSTGLEMSRAEFQDALQRPLAQMLEDRKLWHISSQILRAADGKAKQVEWKVTQSKIRYAVLCYGVPVSITRDAALKETGDDKLRPELRRDEAAVDTELALLPLIEQKLSIAGPQKNPVFATTNSFMLHPTNGVLMVTRLDGPTAGIARGLIDKAIEAETNGMWGRAYFDLRSTTEPGYKLGDDWMREAADACRKLGFETVVDAKPETFPVAFPMSQIAIYCGWYDGHVSGPFTRPNVEFMPGAFAYHLHSFSASNLRSATQNWVGPLLAKGATITMGCVNEPYLTGTPQFAIFLVRLIYDRMTFGEAAYAAQPVLSWQTTIVGDPLYRPFGIPPLQLHAQLQREQSPLIEWSHLRVANLNQAKGATPAALAQYLEQLDTTRHSAVLNEKLADLYQKMGKPESSIETDEKALQLNPSPQQRVRLRLSIADKLAAVSPQEDKYKDAKAFDNYTLLLRENPDYPDKLAIYQKLRPLAEKLGKDIDAKRYAQLISDLTPPPAETNKPPGTNTP